MHYADDDETDPPARGRSVWRFDPTINTGTIFLSIELLVGAAIAYGVYAADKEHTAMRLDQISKDTEANRVAIRDSVALLSIKVDQMQVLLTAVSIDVAVLNAKGRREK